MHVTPEFQRVGSLERPKIVAVDGPAGSGKSSLCFRVCQTVGWTYINTGALYRAVGLLVVREGVDLDDEKSIAAAVPTISRQLSWRDAERALFLNNTNLTPALETEEAGYAASKVAKLPLVRHALLPLQRNLTLSAPKGALVDGRDIGTVVFPDADLKIFLTASLDERAMRRLRQLGSDAEQPGVFEEIKAGLAKRDGRDAGRDVAPLRQAEDAVALDTSAMDIDESIAAIIDLMRGKGLVP